MSKKILLDDVKLTEAAKEMTDIASDLTKLKNQIQELLNNMKSGYDTPAGRKFQEVCSEGLLKLFDDQIAVINHVAENLNTAQTQYQSVFEEYRTLNNKL